ncbi:MAG TPA: TetR/AcrR family transcriptional regulator [Aeromicrobium sp.]|nr:TetR/AcrR family transcriptional regulator [Aeromicrobium sp.]
MSRVDPRVMRSRRAVLEAAVAVLAEVGYGAFTIDAVARRSGVARSTIYRLWEGKAELIDSALTTLNVQPVEPTETPEEARDAVRGLLRHLDLGLNEGPVAACLPALIDGAERDPAIRSFHHDQNDRRRARLAAAISVTTGRDADSDLLAHALAGAVMYARLMTGRRLSAKQLDKLVDLVVR